MNYRDYYSWIALVLLILGEYFALRGIRGNWSCWEPWAITTIVCVFVLWIVGQCLNYSFNFRSVILTKLLANAIVPQRLGTIYLLLFVIHIGWLTNTMMSLYMPDQNLWDVIKATCVCVFGLVTLICFFPDGRKQKSKIPQKVFISGISAINPFNHNLTPLVRMLQLTDDKDTSCELYVLNSSYYSDKNEQEKIKRNYDQYLKEILIKMPKKEHPMAKVLGTNAPINEKLEYLIKMVAMDMFPEKKWIPDGLKIKFSEQEADYNQFDQCFEIVDKYVKAKDTKDNRLYFNLTPGTGIVGSLMTLMAIDGNRSLYYYSQDTRLDEKDKLKEVDKAQVPLHNLLSQALDTLEDNNK